MHGEILAHQEEQVHEGEGQEVVSSGYGASKNVGSTSSGHRAPTERLKIEEADGSNSWKKVQKWTKCSPLWLLRLGQKEYGLENDT